MRRLYTRLIDWIIDRLFAGVATHEGEMMTYHIAAEDLAEYIGKRVLDDADKLRLFMPECYARFPIERDGHCYEIHTHYKGPADAA